ncbi:hypothetical protein MTYM_02024 [Methylococcales bacterium]|nr:hypothetical protein MTYM_02024 [Methylococcales bacterium]
MVKHMDTTQLIISARRAIASLTNDHVIAVAVGWDSATRHARLKYYLSRQPTDEDIDLCSCALAELEAEFGGEIQTASDECVIAINLLDELEKPMKWVYMGRSP